MNLVGVLIAGAVVAPLPEYVRVIIIVLTAGLLTAAILFSKRGGDVASPKRDGPPSHPAHPIAVQKQTQEQTLGK